MHPADGLRSANSDGPLSGKHLLLCVTGSIAAVETVKLIRDFLRLGADITVAMTEAATRIVHPEALWFASGKRVITLIDGDVQHVTLCGSGKGGVDAILVAPCTANMISKLATGVCDDAISTMLITAAGSGRSIIIAPAMHGDMWANKIIKENLGKLVSLGVEVIPPSMDEGKAKMADLETVLLATGRTMLGLPLKGRKVTIIGGSTAEPIDAVRAIANTGTGGTAIALAREAFLQGAEVELIMGHCSLPLPKFVRAKRFKTFADLRKLVSAKKYDIVLVPAAISDYTVEKPMKGKMPSNKDSLSLVLRKTKKIVDSIKADFVMGFKLEAGTTIAELKKLARGRMKSSQMSAIVANRLEDINEDVSRAFLIDRSGSEIELRGSREEIARGIVKYLAKVLK